MNLEKFLKDISFNSRYTFLEEGEDKGELAMIAKKRGIKLPSHDLAVFKSVYGYVGRQNLNGCTLPKEEVSLALDTLVGKAVDFDHMRKRVVGHWIDAELIGDEIIGYGVFYKGNFKEDYDVIKEMMEKDVLAISFEAYGNREFTGDRAYNLRDIEFSGGALLLKTNPAFPGSEVLEMAKERVLELASVMTPPKEYFHVKGVEAKKEKTKNEGFLILQDMETISELLRKVECPTCKERSLGSIEMIDLEKHLLRVSCYNCSAVVKVDLTPSIELIKKGKKVTMDSVKANITNIKKGDNMKEQGKFPTFTGKCLKCNATFESDVRAESIECPVCGGSSVTIGDQASVKEEEKIMKEKIEALEKEIATLKGDLEKKNTELEKSSSDLKASNATIEELKKESTEAKVKIEEVEKAKVKEVEKAKEDATKIAERKSELGEEFSKDVDLLNDGVYELAKAKKELSKKEAEIAELKKGSTNTDKKFVKGSSEKGTGNELTLKADKVRKMFLGEE